METTEKIVLSPDTYENVSRMLRSPDDENVIVGLSALEGMDFKSCKLYMALLYKESSNKKSLWKEHAPNLLKNVEGLGLGEEMTLKSIFNTLKKDASPGELQVFANKFQEMLSVMLKGWGFGDMIDGMNINITVKNAK